MKKIRIIAKNELLTLFYSPIAWLLMIVFVIMTSATLIGNADAFLGLFQRGGPGLAYTRDLTNRLTVLGGRFSYFFNIIDSCYIFFPLITMGLISRETSTGTIKLLYSSPVRIREVVLGKYLAILGFTFCLMILVAVTLLAMPMLIVHTDYSQLLASMFALFLVLGTYASIGLFISSLTSYQIVAAIITLAIFALLTKIGELWQDIDIIRNITFYMNIQEKSTNFVSGLLNTRDLFYFLVFIGGFLVLTMIKIKSGTESISKGKMALRYISVIVVAFLVGYITQRPSLNIYFDATRAQRNTITPPTQAMLAKLNDGELKITCFVNNFSDDFFRIEPSQQNSVIAELWEPYIRFKPDIHVGFVYYYNVDSDSYVYKDNPGKSLKQIAEKEFESRRLRKSLFLAPDEVNRLVDTRREEFRNFFLLEYKGKKAVVRIFQDPMYWPSENEIAATINRLIATPPKIGFLSDEIERGPFSSRIRDYRLITSQLLNRHALINQGYDFDTLSLHTLPSVPTNLAALVIADPRTPILPESQEKINRYIDAGGNLLLASEPDRREITKPLFDRLGLTLRNGLLIQPSANYSSDVVFTHMTDTAKNLSPQWARHIKDDILFWGDTLFRVAMAGANAMEYRDTAGFKVYPLLTSDNTASWNRLAPVSSDSLQTKIGKLASDEKGSFVTAVRMNRNIHGRDQRIIVTSDADYISGPQLSGGETRRYNYDFGFWCFSYFSYGEFPANTLRPESLDSAFTAEAGSIPTMKIIYYWIIPALIGIIASIILIRRKRK